MVNFYKWLQLTIESSNEKLRTNPISENHNELPLNIHHMFS